MDPSEMTTTQRIADALFRTQGTTLGIVLLDARDADWSYERIAKHLSDRTDGDVSVSWRTVKAWIDAYREHDTAGAA